MKKLTKVLALVLALIMAVSVLAACGGDEGGAESTPAGSTPEATTPEASTPTSSGDDNPTGSTSEDLKQYLPPQMNLDREMKVLTGKLYYDEWLEVDDGDLVGTELYNRVLRVESSLGIEMDVEIFKGTDNALTLEEVKKRQESSDPNLIVDVISTYSQYAGTLTVEGRYQQINNSENIDLENPWWPKDLLENSVIDGKVYFVSGDISPTLIYETYAIFYNIELIDKYNIDNPIDMVNDYEWTLDKLIEITSDIYEDRDTSVSGPNIGDFFAFNFNDNAHCKAMPFAMGIRVLEPDEENGYVWSELYMGEKMEVIYDKIGAWVLNNPGVSAESEGYRDYGTSFKNGNCIFTLGNFAYASHYIAGSGIEYGVVPCPLYNDEQEEYYSYYGNPTSFWGIPSNADIDAAAALLEYLAADAYVYISPVLFERALKFKYVTGEVSDLSKMFDIIRDGLVFDACMFYNQKLGSGTYNQFTNITTGVGAWSSQFTNFKKAAMKTKITQFVNILRELPY